MKTARSLAVAGQTTPCTTCEDAAALTVVYRDTTSATMCPRCAASTVRTDPHGVWISPQPPPAAARPLLDSPNEKLTAARDEYIELLSDDRGETISEDLETTLREAIYAINRTLLARRVDQLQAVAFAQ